MIERLNESFCRLEASALELPDGTLADETFIDKGSLREINQ